MQPRELTGRLETARPGDDADAILIAGASICHGIEALGRFYQFGRKSTEGGECFRAFARDYMHEDMRFKKVGDKSAASNRRSERRGITRPIRGDSPGDDHRYRVA